MSAVTRRDWLGEIPFSFLSWWGCLCGTFALALLVELTTVTNGRSIGLGGLTYLLVLGIWSTLPAAVVLGVGELLARVAPRVSRWLWPVLLGALGVAVIHPAALELASGDGVVTRGLGSTVYGGTLTVLVGMMVVIGVLAMRGRRTWGWWSCVGLGFTVSASAWMVLVGTAYGFLIPIAVGMTTVTSATLLLRGLDGYAAVRAPQALALLMCGLAVMISRSAHLEVGRGAVLRAETSARLFEVMVGEPGPAARRLAFSIPEMHADVCAVSPRAAWGSVPPELTFERRRNVIMISLDGLRADVVGATEGGRPVMPELTRIAAQGLVPERAYSPYPATLLAMGSALTGLLPRRILLAPTRPATLFEQIGARVGQIRAILPDDKWYRLEGFRRYVLSGAEVTFHRGADHAVGLAREQLQSWRVGGKTGCLWLHLADAHTPYKKHSGFDFGDSRRQKYLSGAALMDARLGQIFRELETTGWLEDSLIFIFADHGEALGERGYFGHHVYLDSFLTDIPFVMLVPGSRGRRVPGTVQLADITPTVLHFLGLEQTERLLTGVSLLPQIPPVSRTVVAEAFSLRGETIYKHATEPVRNEAELRARAALVERAAPRYEPKTALIGEHYRLIVHRSTGTTELTALRDSGRRELSAQLPQVVDSMLEELGVWQASTAADCLCELREAKLR